MNTSIPDHRQENRLSPPPSRRWALVLIVALLSSFLCTAGSRAAEPEYEIKLATLAPENSSLMQIFREMDLELRRETNGRVGFRIFAGFVLGDEQDVLRKLRIGLVQAATFTDTTLTAVNPDIRVLQVPFLFKNYKEVDYILDKMGGDFAQGFAAKGYEVLGWSELGFIYIMSTVPIATVADLKGAKVWTRADSPMANAVFSRADVTPVTIEAPDVLVALQTNLLQVVYNSPYYALITQWYSRIKYLSDLPLAYIGGALLIDARTLARLPTQDRETLRRVCVKYLRRLTEKTRKDNEEALDIILRRGVKRLTPAPREVDHFKGLLDQALSELDPRYLPRDVLQRVRDELAGYRARGE
jgi:TRAP-type C4-dicarboxylate transport system substrate-binding protein